MLYIAIGIFAVAAIVGIIFTLQRNKKINENGVEADAVVSRIKEIESQDNDGTREVNYEYYVKFQGQDGQILEAKLGNAPRFITEGMHLRIKYLPEKPKFALAVKEEKH